MPFTLFTDSSANLPENIVQALDIRVVSLTYHVNGREHLCYDPNAAFDGNAFYAAIKEGSFIPRTSLVNADTFIKAFEPVVQAGKDALYLGMSSGISGTVQSALTAASELAEKYPQRTVRVVDTLGASLGEGLFVCHAATLRDSGATINDTATAIESLIPSLCQRFLVDDLMYLRRGGRIGGASAVIGTLINLKPIMKGVQGKIELAAKVLGRQKALRALAEYFAAHVIEPETQTVGIAHAACEDDAFALKRMICQRCAVKDFLIVPYEPGTGAHVGPGTVALFFLGQDEGGALNPLLAAVKSRIEAIDARHIREVIHGMLRKKDDPRA